MDEKTSAVRKIQFCSGHRVHLHESKCNNPHGHNYIMFIHARAKKLDALGRVIDFTTLKEILGGWIDKNWDHGFIYYNKDQEQVDIYSKRPDWKSYEMSVNPTAENMAYHFLHDICPYLMNPYGIEIHKIVLWETENCYVEVDL